jgi:hypothetical protein
MSSLNKLYIFITFLTLCINPLFSQINNQTNQNFFNHLYNFEFCKADSLLSKVDSLQKPSQYNFLKSHFIRWYYLPIHEQEEDILTLYNKYLEAVEDETSESDYFFINSSMLKAEFNYNQGHYYKAYQNGSQVYDFIKINLEEPPEKEEVMFLSALYHYYYQYYKTQNPIYGSLMWLFKEGYKEKGLEWLKIVEKGESIAKIESLFYLSHIYLRHENKVDSAFKYAEKLHQLFPENLKFYEIYIESIISKNMDNDMVMKNIQKLINSDKVYFQKYGITYEAIFKSKLDNINLKEKERKLKMALNFIEQNGKGNHLLSLIYNSLYQLTGSAEYLREKNDHEVYQYTLTGYSEKQQN